MEINTKNTSGIDFDSVYGDNTPAEIIPLQIVETDDIVRIMKENSIPDYNNTVNNIARVMERSGTILENGSDSLESTQRGSEDEEPLEERHIMIGDSEQSTADEEEEEEDSAGNTTMADEVIGDILPLDGNGNVTLPNGQKIKAVGNRLYESLYGNQIRRGFSSGGESGTFEAVAPEGRANGIVQGYIIIPKGIEGHGDDGGDEGTIILKDNHGEGGNNNRQYKIQFEYKKGGAVNGIKLAREHRHPQVEDVKGVKYENQPSLQAGGKLEFIGTYQDTNDNGVRLRMFYKNESGQWVRLFDHVDYGDGKEGRPYKGRSGVQDGTRIDGGVNGYVPSKEDREKYKKIKNKPMRTTPLSDDLKNILSKLATSAIFAREIDKDSSNLQDGNVGPLSFGPR
jgi:hypothetical protein